MDFYCDALMYFHSGVDTKYISLTQPLPFDPTSLSGQPTH
jgi:hypothetical protein